MKTTLKLFGVLILVLFQSCAVVDHAPKPTGSAMFYRLGTRGFALDIFVDGVKVGSFSSFARILIPNCGDENAFTVDNLTEGSHKYEARETGTPNPVILKGSVTVVVDQCTKELLVYDWWGG